MILTNSGLDSSPVGVHIAAQQAAKFLDTGA
jgi:hypothetical protein